VKEAHEKMEAFGGAAERAKEKVTDFRKELVNFGLGF